MRLFHIYLALQTTSQRLLYDAIQFFSFFPGLNSTCLSCITLMEKICSKYPESLAVYRLKIILMIKFYCWLFAINSTYSSSTLKSLTHSAKPTILDRYFSLIHLRILENGQDLLHELLAMVYCFHHLPSYSFD